MWLDVLKAIAIAYFLIAGIVGEYLFYTERHRSKGDNLYGYRVATGLRGWLWPLMLLTWLFRRPNSGG